MIDPFRLAPKDIPASVYEVSAALAFCVFPALFILVSASMWFARVSRPPYFAYFCAFGALGSMSLCVATGNNPLAALAVYIAFLVYPFLMVRDLSILRSHHEQSIFHVGARWASWLSMAVIVLLLLWAFVEEYLPKA